MIARRADAIEVARVAAHLAPPMLPPAPQPLCHPRLRQEVIPPIERVDRVRLSDVANWVAYELGVVRGEMIGRSREARYVRARCAVAWVGFHAMRRSLNQIGETLGGRDHSTVFTARTRAEELIDSDPAFAALIDKLLVRLSKEAGQ